MKTSELRSKSPEELRSLEEQLSAELFELRNELRLTDQPKQPHRVQLKRRQRARTLTVLREKMSEKMSEKKS